MAVTYERVGQSRIVVNTAGALRVQFYRDSKPAAADETPTVRVLDLDGEEVIASTAAAAVDGFTGLYEYTLAPQSAPAALTAEWTAELDETEMQFSTAVEIVGAHLFSLGEARSHDSAAMASTSKYPDNLLRLARERIEDAFERICGVSFVPKFARAEVPGDGLRTLILPHVRITEILSISTRTVGTSDWTALSAAAIADTRILAGGEIYRETLGVWPLGRHNIRVEYVHGHPRPPAEVSAAALTVLRDQVVGSNIPDRATVQLEPEIGRFELAVAGRRGAWFGIPSVDAVLKRYNETVPVFG